MLRPAEKPPLGLLPPEKLRPPPPEKLRLPPPPEKLRPPPPPPLKWLPPPPPPPRLPPPPPECPPPRCASAGTARNKHNNPLKPVIIKY
ncbi:hypothetical protein FO440_12045 [Mucilaginibacter corticis]|uniref:Uncharacterized protein n=1 Tax=Mucilaginibacter corticis TaxID=2597670 RepID=A0A556MKM7_9SPHI|nr:hypothetical protein FO440_12045 [Mucilaginibacter corticis]